MQRHYSNNSRCNSHRNLGITHIRYVSDTVYIKAMNLGMKGATDIGGVPGKINRGRSVAVDRKAFRLEPCGDGLYIFGGQAESLPEFRGRESFVIEGRFGVLLIACQFIQRLLLFRRKSQQELHVLHGQTVRNGAAIVCGSGFGARVSGKNDVLIPIDWLSYHTSRRLRWSSLRASCTGPPHDGKKSCSAPR